jgi:UPF0716 protein FxsA
MGFGRVFLFIFVFALLEAVVLGQVAQSIGWGVTILLTVLTAMMGSLLFRWQGVETWVRLNKRMQKGEMPGAEMVEGVMLLLGGALLITPGFITDGIGFLLLLPQSRRAFAGYIVKKGMMQAFTSGPGQSNVWVYRSTTAHTSGPGYTGQQSQADNVKSQQERPKVYEDNKGHYIIEGEAQNKDDAS